jgi:hypothetical protein
MNDDITVENDGEDFNNLEDGDSLVPRQPEDNSTPFSAPDDNSNGDHDNDSTESSLNEAQPELDSASDIDSTQAYNEGISGAAEENFPPESDVTSYDPAKDNR